MVEIGWSFPYLESKIAEYKDLAARERLSNDAKERYEEQASIYETLFLDLFFQEGTTYRESVSIADFLSIYHNVFNAYRYDARLENKFSNITRQFIEMQGFQQYKLNPHFRKDEALELVGEFIKDTFGLQDFQVYEDFFLKKKEYVLFDKNDDTAHITFTLEGERFIKLPSDRTVNMAAKIAHEAGHNYRMSQNPIIASHNILGEVESFGYEINFINWMMEHNIYGEDAAKYMLNSMHQLENVMIARYYNNRYKLTQIQSPEKFQSRIDEFAFFERMQPDNILEIFDTLGTAVSENMPMYLYSFLFVLNSLQAGQFLSTYREETKEFGKTDSKVLTKRLLPRDITDLSAYRDYRETLVNKASLGK